MSLILRLVSWLTSRGSRVRRVAANENAAPKARIRKKKTPRAPVVVHVIGHRLPIVRLGRPCALDVWNLSDPTRLTLLYLRHGRRLRLPAPAAIVEFGKAAQRTEAARTGSGD
jgi:hypothetical protein